MHPTLDGLNFIRDAVLFCGDDEASPFFKKLGKMGFEVDMDLWSEGGERTFDALNLYHSRLDFKMACGFAPPAEVGTSMFVNVLDDDSMTVEAIPVLASVLFRPSRGVRVVESDGIATIAPTGIVLCTSDSSLLELPGISDFFPVVGPFDGEQYRFVDRVLARNTPLEDIVGLAVDLVLGA